MPDGYNFSAFGSTNPALAELFKNEFMARQGAQQAAQSQAAQETARQQIMAQSQLAQAQLQGTQSDREYNRIWKEKEFNAKEEGDKVKEGQANRLLDIQEKAYGVKPGEDLQRRKQAIIDANSTAINDAQRANALLQINTDAAVAAAKKALPMGAGLFGGPTAANLDDPNHPARQLIQKQAFDAVRSQLLAEKGGALNNLIPDPGTFTFKPIQFDETGKAIALPLPSPGSSTNSAALGAPPKTGYDDSGNADAPGGTLSNPAALGSMSPQTQAIASVAQPVINKVLGSAADMFGIKAPTVATPAPVIGQPSVKRLLGSATVLLTPEDDAALQRQLVSVIPEQRPAAYKAIVGQLLQSRRAVMGGMPPQDPYSNFDIPSTMY